MRGEQKVNPGYVFTGDRANCDEAVSVTGQWSDWYLQELPSMQTSVQPAGLASRIDNWSTSYLNILSAI